MSLLDRLPHDRTEVLVQLSHLAPPPASAACAGVDLSGFDILVVVFRHMLGRRVELSLWHREDLLTEDSMNPIARYAWQDFVRPQRVTKEVRQGWVAEKLSVLALLGVRPAADSIDFQSLADHPVMVTTLWSQPEFRLMCGILRRWGNGPDDWSLDTIQDRTELAANNQLAWDDGVDTFESLYQVFNDRCWWQHQDGVTAMEYSAMPLFVRVAYKPKPESPRPFRELAGFDMYRSTPKPQAGGPDQLYIAVDEDFVYYSLFAVVRLRFAADEHEWVRTYSPEGLVPIHANVHIINEDWSLEDPGEHKYVLIYTCNEGGRYNGFTETVPMDGVELGLQS